MSRYHKMFRCFNNVILTKLLLLSAITLISTTTFTQEICNNGIDDDGDFLIDLNDTDCDCEDLEGFISLVPNPSFEDTLCCPESSALLECAASWMQASWATSDYYNLCGYDWSGLGLPAELPLPGGGSGFVGFGQNTWEALEMVGTCLTGIMYAGETYSLSMYTAWSSGANTLNLSLYGTPNCADLPWVGIGCPVGIGGWELLNSTAVTYTMDGAWQEVTLTFTPAVDMNAIAIGGPCGLVAKNAYFYLDGLNLTRADHATTINESGDWCDGNLVLSTSIDTVGGA